jgi:hypothetical protein
MIKTFSWSDLGDLGKKLIVEPFKKFGDEIKEDF